MYHSTHTTQQCQRPTHPPGKQVAEESSQWEVVIHELNLERIETLAAYVAEYMEKPESVVGEEVILEVENGVWVEQEEYQYGHSTGHQHLRLKQYSDEVQPAGTATPAPGITTKTVESMCCQKREYQQDSIDLGGYRNTKKSSSQQIVA